MVKKNAPGKGPAAEEALANYFRAAGFFAIRSLPFRHEGADLTDLDVWLYERGSGLGRRRFIVDSKNKKSPRVVERLFWTCGLQKALGLDGGFVAATGAREPTRRVARRLGITLIDLQVIGRGNGLDSLRDPDRLTREEIDALLAEADRQHETKDWRQHRDDLLAALLTSFGASSANTALRAARFYGEHLLSSAPSSSSREIGLRLFFLSCSAAAVALDYVAAQTAFQPSDQRRQELEDAVRFGNEPGETKARLDLAVELVRSFLPNGVAAASQLREKVTAASSEVPADIIAEVVAKMAWKGHLFEAARELDRAAHQRVLPPFAGLSTDARSFLGAVLDFSGVDRTTFATASGADQASPKKAERPSAKVASTSVGSLFDTNKPDS